MKNRRALPVPALFLLLLLFSGAGAEEKGRKWPGVDETVIEKFAKTQGREAQAPVIDTDRGDLLLFLFLLAGAVGGFVAGYFWRLLVSEKKGRPNKEPQRWS